MLVNSLHNENLHVMKAFAIFFLYNAMWYLQCWSWASSSKVIFFFPMDRPISDTLASQDRLLKRWDILSREQQHEVQWCRWTRFKTCSLSRSAAWLVFTGVLRPRFTLTWCDWVCCHTGTSDFYGIEIFNEPIWNCWPVYHQMTLTTSDHFSAEASWCW